ncbi:MAG: DUF4743 domain-containing protein [Alphaproteobacteria bacterium]|nr:DUF4743 domain-containing protein [Alphaproteobacteria bacterium]
MSDLQAHIRHCTAWQRQDYRTLWLGGTAIGLIRPDVAASLPSLLAEGADWRVAADPKEPDSVGDAMDALTRELLVAGWIRKHRRERYPLLTQWGGPLLGSLDRAAVAALGVKAFGVHLNGYVRRADGVHLWIGKRADDKAVAPGELDNMVAGGQPVDLSLFENLLKECWEEAALPATVASAALPVGAIGYTMAVHEGLRRHTLFLYDLELPEDVIPHPNDDEMQWFQLWPATRVLAALTDGTRFKFNVALVLIDFLIRHGVIGPDHPEYLALIAGLRQFP